MNGDPADVPKIFTAAERCTQVDTFATSSGEVADGVRRLEGAFYGSDGYRAVLRMKRSGFLQGRVGDRASVLWFGPFSRTYVDDPKAGVPFLSSSEIMEARPSPKNHISLALTKNLKRLIVHDGTILVSCSGTIGNVAICTKDLDGVAISQHAIRVIPRRDRDRAVIHAFLQSEVGQFLLTRSKSGSVIESLYEADVSNLPVPRLPRAIEIEMAALLRKCSALRVRANQLLEEAEADVQRVCYLPELSDVRRRGLLALSDSPLCFAASLRDHRGHDHGTGQIRLDATFFEPRAQATRSQLFTDKKARTLGELTRFVRRSGLRQRTYVDSETHGVPLLGGKEMMQTNIREVKYVSRVLTKGLSREIIDNGDVLVSCGGTLGRVMLSHRNYAGWCASEHVMRIGTDPIKALPGYIYAFLCSRYGQIQIHQRTHGSVIPQIRDFELALVGVPVPSDKGEHVHDKVVAAFDARADAREAESQLIGLFDAAMERGREYIEREWGSAY